MESQLSKNKFYKKWLLIALISAFSMLILAYFYLKSSLAILDGQVQLPNLKSKVTLSRDQFGIPHITASNTQDAFRVLGYTIAGERLFQMEMMRRMASGELSEIVGEKLLKSDKLFRSLGLKNIMQKMIDKKMSNHSFDVDMLKDIQAFYEGVNEYQDTQKLPIEFDILGIKPRPFSILDGYVLIGLMNFSFGTATTSDPLLSQLRIRLGKELSDELRNESLNSLDKLKTQRVVSKEKTKNEYFIAPMNEIISELERGFILFEGSNGWLLSKDRTMSGYPILANDPHITYSHPGVWFEAHIKTPQFETYGHFLSLIPFPILSHNHEMGWGITMSMFDDMDLYRESLNPKLKSFEHSGKNYPYKERLEEIKIKNSDTYKMLVLETLHGPVMDEVFEDKNQKSLALKWAFLSEDNDPLTPLYKMSHAKDMESFKQAVSMGKAPGLNILYADKKNIAWWIFGDVAIKSKNQDSDFVLDGVSGKDEYLGLLPFNKKPFLENPKSGIIVSGNSRPEALPADLRGDFQPDDRTKTITTILAQKLKWTADENKEIQITAINLENKLILDALLKELNFNSNFLSKKYSPYISILNSWNFESEAHSIGASLYYTWCRELSRLILKDLSNEEFLAFSRLPNHWAFLKRYVLNIHSAFNQKFNRKNIITESFIKTIETLTQELGEDSNTWSWGHLHTLEFVHPIGKMKPLNYIFNLGPYEVSGATMEINNQKYSGYTDGFKVKSGPSTRRIIDFGEPENASGILPMGQSGHLLSPFYKDQVELFIHNKYRPMLIDASMIKKAQTHYLEFTTK